MGDDRAKIRMNQSNEAVLDFLINKLDNVSMLNCGHIAHFCPFCQKNGTKADGRKWSKSKRKGYILIEADNLNSEPVFYCHNEQCISRKMIAGRKSLPIDVYANYVINQVGTNTRHLSDSLSIDSHEGNHSPMKVVKLPPSTKSDLNKGCQLDGQVAQRNSRQRCLWAGYADRKAGRI